MNHEVNSMLQYFGESPVGALTSESGTKPEDFFGLISTFSSDLQVSGTWETHVRTTYSLLKQRAATDMKCLPAQSEFTVPNVTVTMEADKPMSELLVGVIYRRPLLCN